MINIRTSATPSVAQWKAVIAGCRNPYASWDKSDSTMHFDGNTGEIYHMIGNADLDLMKRLSRSGDDHGKFLRMLPVIADIRAPLYWWKQLDTYKIGTVANSDSTMHCIHKQEFSLDDFSYDEIDDETMSVLCDVIKELNRCRSMYNVTKERSYWNSMITLLPESYMQHRTWSTNYQTLKHIYNARKDHKLGEWHDFCQWITSLPYAEIITLEASNEQQG